MATKSKPKQPWFVVKLKKLGACSEALRYAQKHRTFAAAWNACPDVTWQKWLLHELELLKHDYANPGSCPSCETSQAQILRRFPAERVAKAL